MMWEAVRRPRSRSARRRRCGWTARWCAIRRDGQPHRRRRDRPATAGEAIVRGHRLHLEHAAHRARREARPACAAARCWRRPRRLTLPRLPHRVPDRRPARSLPRQLDLRPRSRGPGRPHPELQELEPGHGAGPGQTSLGLEYFCTEGDELWALPDAELIELGKRELEHIGLAARPRSRTAAWSACPRPTRSTTPLSRRTWPWSARSSTASRTSRPSAATACTATTTRTTPC